MRSTTACAAPPPRVAADSKSTTASPTPKEGFLADPSQNRIDDRPTMKRLPHALNARHHLEQSRKPNESGQRRARHRAMAAPECCASHIGRRRVVRCRPCHYHWDDGTVSDLQGNPRATSTPKFEADGTVKAYATLRFAGDRLEPQEISDVLGVNPHSRLSERRTLFCRAANRRAHGPHRHLVIVDRQRGPASRSGSPPRLLDEIDI